MTNGHRSSRSTGRVSCKSTELKRCSMVECVGIIIIIIIIITIIIIVEVLTGFAESAAGAGQTGARIVVSSEDTRPVVLTRLTHARVQHCNVNIHHTIRCMNEMK